MSPERIYLELINKKHEESLQTLKASDVWGIGASFYSLVTNSMLIPQDMWNKSDQIPQYLEHKNIKQSKIYNRNNTIDNSIREMLDIDYRNRPTARKLWTYIQKHKSIDDPMEID